MEYLDQIGIPQRFGFTMERRLYRRKNKDISSYVGIRTIERWLPVFLKVLEEVPAAMMEEL